MAKPDAPLVAFFDIDGTLIDSDPEAYAAAQAPDATDEQRTKVFLPTDTVRRAVADFVDAGNLAFLCSGRPPSGLSMLMANVPFSGYVALAGAMGTMGGRELFRHSVDPALMEHVVDIFTDCEVGVMLEGTEASVIWMPPGEHPDIDLSLPVVRDRAEISRLIPELSVVKAFWMAEEHPKLAPREQELRERFTVSDLGVGGFELSPKEISKATGMADVLEAVGDHGTVYGFGDSENDLSMLRAADVAVVMANGVPGVLELADVVAPPVSEDGVAQVLEQILAEQCAKKA